MSTRNEINKDAADVVFTGCGVTSAAPAQAQPGGRRRQVVVNGRRVKTIDVHAHCVIPETLVMMGKKLEDQRGPGLGEVGGERIRAMDEQGIDVEALSINPFWYREERDRAAEICRIQNEKLAERIRLRINLYKHSKPYLQPPALRTSSENETHK